MNSFEDVFARVKEYCLKEGGLSEVAVKLWIGSLQPLSLSGSIAAFTVQSDFQRNIVLQNYEDLLKEAFENVLGFPVEMVIQVVETDDDYINPRESSPRNAEEIDKRHASLEKSLEGANYEYTFSTFIVGRSNEFAYAACTAVAKEPGKNYNPLFIYGPSGLRKNPPYARYCP